jgi:hypothetical protein
MTYNFFVDRGYKDGYFVINKRVYIFVILDSPLPLDRHHRAKEHEYEGRANFYGRFGDRVRRGCCLFAVNNANFMIAGRSLGITA